MRNLILATSAAIAVSTAAIAGNPASAPTTAVTVIPPVVASSAIWDGFYAGGTVGSVGGNLDFLNPDTLGLELLDETTYGAFAGYNIQRGNFVFGGEVAYSTGDLSLVDFPAEVFTYFADLKGRVGYASGNLLAFGFVGYSMSEYDNQFDEAKSMSGLNYGAGVDLLVGDNMFVGAEYIVRNLNGEGNTDVPGQTREAQIQAVQLRVGWNF